MKIQEAAADKAGASFISVLTAGADIGFGPMLVEAMLMLGEIEATEEEMKYLLGPVIFEKSAWSETVPKWMPERVLADRLRVVTKQLPRHIVAPVELAIVIYAGGLDKPLPSTFTHLYAWAGSHAISAQFGKDPIEGIVSDDEVFDPRSDVGHLYAELASDLRRRVVKRSTWRKVDAREFKAPKSSPLRVEVAIEGDLFTGMPPELLKMIGQ